LVQEAYRPSKLYFFQVALQQEIAVAASSRHCVGSLDSAVECNQHHLSQHATWGIDKSYEWPLWLSRGLVVTD